jgi:hypothetical protein
MNKVGVPGLISLLSLVAFTDWWLIPGRQLEKGLVFGSHILKTNSSLT